MSYKKWLMNMPFSRIIAPSVVKKRGITVDRDKAMYVYVLIKNGVSAWKLDPNGRYRSAYKYLVGWHTVVDENGKVIKGADPDIKRLHDEGIL